MLFTLILYFVVIDLLKLFKHKVTITKTKKKELFLEKNGIQFSNNFQFSNGKKVPTLTEFFSHEDNKDLGSGKNSTKMWPTPNSHLQYINNMRKLEKIINGNGARSMNNTNVRHENAKQKKQKFNPSKLNQNNSKLLSKPLKETTVIKNSREKKKLVKSFYFVHIINN